MNFYRIEYIFENERYHKATISPRQLEGITLPVPAAVALLLRAELDCIPIEIVGKK